MQRGLRRVLSLVGVVALVALAACNKDESVLEEQAAAQDAVVAELEEAKEALDAKRDELAEVQANLEASAAEAADEAAAEAENLEQRAEELKAEIEEDAADLGARIVDFINSDPPTQGEPFNERQKRAFAIKVDEDILLANQWIEDGGDYRKAITIFEGLLPFAPDDARLEAELARAREMRYMTEERFAGVEKDMTEDEVRELLGPVNLRNVRPYEEKKVTAWFYPKDPETGGGASGVWFKESKGQLRVYKMDFNAIKTDGEEEGA